MRLSSGTSKIQGLFPLVAVFKFSLLLTLILMSLSLMAGGAYAATYYIAASGGNDSNNGTSTSTPWATFAYAIGQLSAGDTLTLMDGTYSTIYGSLGSVIDLETNGTNGSPITIQALNKGQAILNCNNSSNYYGVFSTGDYNIIKNLVIQNCGAGIYLDNGSNSIALGNTIHDSETGIIFNSSTNYATIDSNIIYNFGCSAPDCLNQNHGIYGRGESTIIQNNLVYGNSGSGWSIQIGVDGTPVPSGNWQVVNNTLVGTANSNNNCIFVYGSQPTFNIYFFNNICSGATSGLVGTSDTWGTGWYAEYNLMDSTSAACFSDGGSCTNAISSNVNYNLYNTSAGFINTSGDDYNLAYGSAAIGAGTSIYAPPYDIIGTTRPQGSGYDIGAYQYVNTFATIAGGGSYTSQSGVVYQPDTYYSGGTAASTTAAISGTWDPTLYQSERYGNFSYNIPLANGNYTVTLKLAEIYWNAAGQRIFNVSMQGTQVISNLDIYAQVGNNAAYDLSFPVSVTNGLLNINFTSVVDYAKVSAIDVTPN